MARVVMLTTVLAASGTGVALAADTTSDHSGALSGKNVNVGSGHQPCHCAPHRRQSSSSGQPDTGGTIGGSTPRSYAPSGIHHHSDKTPCHSSSHGSPGSGQPVSLRSAHTPSGAHHGHKPCRSASHGSPRSGQPVSISIAHTPSGAHHRHKPCHGASHGNARPVGIGYTPRNSSHNSRMPCHCGHGSAGPAGLGRTPGRSARRGHAPSGTVYHPNTSVSTNRSPQLQQRSGAPTETQLPSTRTSSELPTTGANIGALVALAGIALVLGTGTLSVTRRRPRRMFTRARRVKSTLP